MSNMKSWLAWFARALLLSALGVLPLLAEDSRVSSMPPNVLDGPALVAALQGGGYVIYFRHGITDQDTSDQDRVDLNNCQAQRQLSEAGREQMRRVGRLMGALHIRVSTILSSPYCRSIETVTLAFGRALIEPDLKHTVTASQETAARQAVALRRMLATAPPVPGTNTVLSGHTGNLQEATGIWPEPEGVAVIFRPDGQGSFRFIATVTPAHWEQLLTAQ